MVIWSVVEPGLGIVAAAACVLRPLARQFCRVSSFSINRIPEAHNDHSIWHNERVNGSKTFPNHAQQHEIGNEGMEMERIVTSALGDYTIERAREWIRKSPSIMRRERVVNESEEELATGENRIFVQRTVEVTR